MPKVGPPRRLLRHCKGPEIQAAVACVGTTAASGRGPHRTRHQSSLPSPRSSVIGRTRMAQPYIITKPARWDVGDPSTVSGMCAVLPSVGSLRGLQTPLEPLPGQPCGVRGAKVTVREQDRDALRPGLVDVRRDSTPRSWLRCWGAPRVDPEEGPAPHASLPSLGLPEALAAAPPPPSPAAPPGRQAGAIAAAQWWPSRERRPARAPHALSPRANASKAPSHTQSRPSPPAAPQCAIPLGAAEMIVALGLGHLLCCPDRTTVEVYHAPVCCPRRKDHAAVAGGVWLRVKPEKLKA